MFYEKEEKGSLLLNALHGQKYQDARLNPKCFTPIATGE